MEAVERRGGLMCRMRRGLRLVLVASLLAAGAAHADRIEENEPLVMRLIFDDCLGYIRDDKAPFQGLATRVASVDVIGTLSSHSSEHGKVVELLSPRYVAAWGEDKDARYCVVRMAWSDQRPPGVGLLGVRSAGFLTRVAERAAAEGITERYPDDLDDEFSPFNVYGWGQQETGHQTGPLRPIRFSVLASGEGGAENDVGLVEVSSIGMGGPPLLVSP